MDFEEAVQAGLIEIMGEETDRAFMKEVMAMVNDRESMSKVADTFKVVYTPFHGCGWKLVPEALRGLGVKHLYCVEQQMVLDGNFPTVVSPNPENPEGFYLAIDLANQAGPTASPAATPSPALSLWPRKRRSWSPPVRVRSFCPTRRATAI